MNLSKLTRSDIPQILDSHDVKIRSKDDPIWYHAPLIWAQIAIVWMSGKTPRAFSITLPLFLGGAVVYLSGDYDVEAIRRGQAPLSAMPLLVHELTHAFQIIELGWVLFSLYYLAFPAPIFWTGRSTLEWEAEANEILWIREAFGSGEYIDDMIVRSADVFTSSTYVWATTDRSGWIQALWRYLIDYNGAPSDAVSNDLCWYFGGYNVRG